MKQQPFFFFLIPEDLCRFSIRHYCPSCTLYTTARLPWWHGQIPGCHFSCSHQLPLSVSISWDKWMFSFVTRNLSFHYRSPTTLKLEMWKDWHEFSFILMCSRLILMGSSFSLLLATLPPSVLLRCVPSPLPLPPAPS